MSEVFYRRFLLLSAINAVLYAVVGIALMLLVAFGVFNFMAGWSLPLVFLFFFLLWALVYETYSAAALFLLKQFFDGFRCRLRPPAVCILYKPKEYLRQQPVLGGFVFPGLFFTAAFIIDEKSWQHELQHVRDAPLDAGIRYVRDALFFTWFVAMIVLKTVLTWLAPLFSATVLVAILPYAMEFRAYRRDGVPLLAALERIEAGKKIFGGLPRNHIFYLVLILWTAYQAVIYGQPHPDLPPNYVAMAVAGGSALVFALVLRWALGVFTRRLFGIDVGDFLFSSFVVGAVFHPLLGVFTSFLFSWSMFGKAKDAAVAAAVAALSLFAVLLPGWIWTSVLLL
ncbi:MAG: hypothetical protein ACO2PN_19535 [Pyrobaculum sp.]|jgi:hypothetical protein